MGLLKRMFGRETEAERDERAQQSAVQRYRYLLRTAPPEAIEEAHAEAFAALTPEQRREVLAELSAVTPENERPTSDDPESLARAATRAEMRQPGTLERSFGNAGGAGSMVAGSLLAGIAGAFVGTAIATAVFSDLNNDGGNDGGSGETGDADPGMGSDWSGDMGGGDFGGGF
jgi:hypothetical protein